MTRVRDLLRALKLLSNSGVHPFSLNPISLEDEAEQLLDWQRLPSRLQYVVSAAERFGQSMSYDRCKLIAKDLSRSVLTELEDISTRRHADVSLWDEWMKARRGSNEEVRVFKLFVFLDCLFDED